jgi:hypothetical protein
MGILWEYYGVHLPEKAGDKQPLKMEWASLTSFHSEEMDE